jgi:hypothetical protein
MSSQANLRSCAQIPDPAVSPYTPPTDIFEKISL